RVLDAYAGPAWLVDDVTLVESHLPREKGHRPRHHVLARLPLLSHEGCRPCCLDGKGSAAPASPAW
ncbi:MAG: hypothetical protein ABIU87_11820, partial [Ornithinibacter sp.]